MSSSLTQVASLESEINLESIPEEAKLRLPLRKLIPLRRRKILKKSLGSALVVFVVGGVLTAIGYLLLRYMPVPQSAQNAVHFGIVVWFAFLGALMFYRMVYQYLYYLTYFYDANDQILVIRKGVIAKTEINVPFKRITDVYVDQDIPDVLLGIYDVHISTPTQESGNFAHIDGVNREGAYRLRAMILERIHKEEG